ncbi:MAG: phosphotransferase [Acidimicrobiales bacterium]
MLGDLHQQLHRIAAPPWLDVAPLEGDRLLHRDLHPMNVILTTDGAVVIDWSNASAGDPAFDVADTWALFACASAPAKGLDRILIPLGRRVMLRSFLGQVDRAAARRAIPAAVAHRLTDRNMSDNERERLRRFGTWATAGR